MNVSIQISILILSLSTNKVKSEISSELVNLINSIYFGIKAQTLVLFHYHTAQQINNNDEALWQKLEQPKIVLTLQGGEELRPKFNSQILAVIIMDTWQWSHRQWQHLATVIKKWSSTDILFLTYNMNSTNVQSREKFLKQCWHKGLSRILLTSFEEPMTAYTIHPFPLIAIKTTSVSLFIKERGRFLDCHGYPLRVSAGNNPPRSLVYYNTGGDIVYRGYILRLIQIFAQRFNLTIQWVLMPNFTQNYSLSDCVRYLLNHQIDICGDILPLNEKLYVIAPPLFISNALLIVPFAQTRPKYKYFLQPFDQKLWFFIIAMLIYVTSALSLINRLKLGFWEMDKFFLKSLQSVLYLSYRLPPWRGIQKSLAFTILTLGGFIVSNLYVAFLSSILAANVYEPQIESLEDLKRRKITIAINDMDKDVLELYNSLELLSDNYLQLDISTYRRLRNSLDPRYAYANVEDKANFYLYQQKFLQRPLLRIVGRPIFSLYGCIPMQMNWPLESLLNQFVLSMFDTGIIKYIEGQTMEEGITLGHTQFLKTTNLDVCPLGISYFQMPALLLAGGYLTALLCFVVEKGLEFLKK